MGQPTHLLPPVEAVKCVREPAPKKLPVGQPKHLLPPVEAVK